jgi:molybdopterin adenylyltransferase
MSTTKAVAKHKKSAPRKVNFSLLLVSDRLHGLKEKERAREDESGNSAAKLIQEAGHKLLGREYVSNNRHHISEAIIRQVVQKKAQVLLAIGGTGLSPRDVTVDTVRSLGVREIEGFGEFFRQKSERQIGTAAFLSRATAGVLNETTVVCLPGSPDAVSIGLGEVLLPEIGHLVGQVAGDSKK